jgi:hypothetical protein
VSAAAAERVRRARAAFEPLGLRWDGYDRTVGYVEGRSGRLDVNAGHSADLAVRWWPATLEPPPHVRGGWNRGPGRRDAVAVDVSVAGVVLWRWFLWSGRGLSEAVQWAREVDHLEPRPCAGECLGDTRRGWPSRGGML